MRAMRVAWIVAIGVLLTSCGGSSAARHQSVAATTTTTNRPSGATIHEPFDSSLLAKPAELQADSQRKMTDIVHACRPGVPWVKVLWDGNGAPPPKYFDCNSFRPPAQTP
jgi:hypothetical protein